MCRIQWKEAAVAYFKVLILSWHHLELKEEDIENNENSTCSLDSKCVLPTYKQGMLVT